MHNWERCCFSESTEGISQHHLHSKDILRAQMSELHAQSWFGLWGPLVQAASFQIQAGSGSGFVAPELLLLLAVGWISICGITIWGKKTLRLLENSYMF